MKDIISNQTVHAPEDTPVFVPAEPSGSDDAGSNANAGDLSKAAIDSLQKAFRKPILTRFTQAITKYDLVSPGDHIAVCISGGKDSMLLALCFKELKRRNKFPFSLTFLCMDPGYTEANRRKIEENARLLDIPLTIFETDIFGAVYEIEKSPCYLCARMRRGHLYKQAQDLGCNKIALGHHFDDVIETGLLSILYSGQIQTMMPKIVSDNFPGMELIRPFFFVREADIIRFRDAHHLSFLRCACRFTEAHYADEAMRNGDSGSKRLEVKNLIAKLKETNPSVEANLFRSYENVHLGAVLGYKDKDKQYHSFLDSYGQSESADESRCDLRPGQT